MSYRTWRGNDPPPNLIEISPDEFGEIAGKIWEHEEYQQVHVLEEDGKFIPGFSKFGSKVLAGRLIWVDEHSGFFLAQDWSKGFKTRFFKFGCHHEMQELSVKECVKKNIPHFGQHWHVLQCSKCGMIQSVDSSD